MTWLTQQHRTASKIYLSLGYYETLAAEIKIYIILFQEAFQKIRIVEFLRIFCSSFRFFTAFTPKEQEPKDLSIKPGSDGRFCLQEQRYLYG